VQRRFVRKIGIALVQSLNLSVDQIRLGQSEVGVTKIGVILQDRVFGVCKLSLRLLPSKKNLNFNVCKKFSSAKVAKAAMKLLS